MNIEKVANYLKTISVKENYDWDIPFSKGHGSEIFSIEDIKKFSGKSNYECNVLLKQIISDKIKSAKKNNDKNQLKKLFEWIVHDWGGIRGGRNNIDKLFVLGINAIEKNNLEFDRIASTSKILSFYKPSENVIYDSRVAFSLNSLLLLENASDLYFPIPTGTNSKMNAFNIEVLIRLKHKIPEYKRKKDSKKKVKLISNADKKLFIPPNQAYLKMRDVIKEINSIVYQDDKNKVDYPYNTEMLLFGIADTIIYDRILEEVMIDIK